MHRPHAAHIIEALPPDGAERLIADLMRNCSGRYRFSVLCLDKGGPLQAEIEAVGVPVTILGRRRKWDPSAIIRLARWLRREKVVIVHTHLFAADAYGRIAARLAAVPGIFSTSHNIDLWYTPLHRRIDWALQWITTRIIACSDVVARVLTEEGGIRESKVVIIRNGVDLTRVTARGGEAIRAEFSIPPETPLLGVIGRLHPQKGHVDLFEALALVQQAGADFHCLVVGSGELEAELKARSAAGGLADRVTFTGQRADVPAILDALNIFVMSSRWEGLPIALLEAMAVGKTCLLTRVGGIPDAVTDGHDAILVAPQAPDELASALLALVSDAGERERLARNAATTVRTRYDVALTAQSYEALYDDVLSAT